MGPANYECGNVIALIAMRRYTIDLPSEALALAIELIFNSAEQAVGFGLQRRVTSLRRRACGSKATFEGLLVSDQACLLAQPEQ